MGDFGLLWCCGAAEVVKGDVEPFVHVGMDFVIFIADFLAGQAFAWKKS